MAALHPSASQRLHCSSCTIYTAYINIHVATQFSCDVWLPVTHLIPLSWTCHQRGAPSAAAGGGTRDYHIHVPKRNQTQQTQWIKLLAQTHARTHIHTSTHIHPAHPLTCRGCGRRWVHAERTSAPSLPKNAWDNTLSHSSKPLSRNMAPVAQNATVIMYCLPVSATVMVCTGNPTTCSRVLYALYKLTHERVKKHYNTMKVPVCVVPYTL